MRRLRQRRNPFLGKARTLRESRFRKTAERVLAVCECRRTSHRSRKTLANINGRCRLTAEASRSVKRYGGPYRSISACSIEHHRHLEDQSGCDLRVLPTNSVQIASDKFVFQPSTLDKLIIGIWEQVHGSINLDPKAIFEQFQVSPTGSSMDVVRHAQAEAMPTAMTVLSSAASTICDSFSQMNVFCRKVTQASRVCRSIEMIVQARWTELFEEQVQYRCQTRPDLSTTKHRKGVFMEACQDFGWSEYVSLPLHDLLKEA